MYWALRLGEPPLEMEGGGDGGGGYDDKGLVFGEEGRGKGNNELSTLDKD